MSDNEKDKLKAPKAGEAPESTEDTVITEDQADMRQETESEAMETLDKLPITASFEELVERIPGMDDMVGMDQKSDFHCLTLDEHTKELVKNLEQDPFVKNHPKKDLILLAGKLHDIGKISPEGQQDHPTKAGQKQYAGHEKESARMIEELLPKYFVDLDKKDLDENDAKLVIKIAELHVKSLNFVKGFDKNNLPKGKSLNSFVSDIETIPGDLELEDKIKILLAITKADNLGKYNEESDRTDPKVQEIINNVDKVVENSNEIEKALPFIIQAVQAKRLGQEEIDNKIPANKRKGDPAAGIAYDEKTDKYSLTKPKAKPKELAMDGKQIGLIMKNLGAIGVENKDKGAFGKALREGGIAGLGKAGFGKYIGAVKKLTKENE
ncbi:HD domain-containing protein [Patescibacteria group bacterium]